MIWLPCRSVTGTTVANDARSRTSHRRGSSPSSLGLLLLLLLLLANVQLSWQQNDPVSNFCRRFGHQTAIVDDRLYIDGGFLNYNPLEQYPENYTNDYLFFHDLSTVASSGMPQLYANLSKNRTVPSLHGGVLWGDSVNKRLYQFGGEVHRDRTTPFRGVYAYDILADQWDFFSLDHVSQPASTVIYRTSYGAGVAIPERGEGYYYGGWVSNRSEPSWGDTPVANSYLVKYEMDKNLWTNSSGPPDRIGRAEGSMVYIPAGDAGMLVYLGGVQDKFGNGSVIQGQPMDEILLYDVLSFKWYKQKASGEVPDMRSRFCSGVAWAPDRSSYNIYLYGGAGMPPNTTGFDDIYILSLPSFTWIKLYPNDTSSTGEYPHHSLSCNMHLDSAQMLIIGGSFPASDMCDTPEQWGVHNLDTGRRNPDEAVWQLYDPEKKGYTLPFDVWDVIGGSEAGASTKKEPDDGFSSPDLKVLLSRTASAAAREPTRDLGGGDDSGGGLSKGAIAGIAVGGAAGLIALVALIIFLFRKKRGGGGSSSSHHHNHQPQMSFASHNGYPSPYYPVNPMSPLAASPPHPPTTPGTHDATTATPDSAHAKLDSASWTPDGHTRSYSTLQAHSPHPTSPGANTAYTGSSGFGGGEMGPGRPQELSATPGFERRRDREPPRMHETYYHA
ncbi:hypothetical protein jhhlp_001247 [Lomentospora prolificans]|uniref:Kelch repeat-containing protein n=1 Tax=Lomentospora prolificans TaxID=41688 RepID=A0A2N3NHS3_9PEZI|nr:hypothetical protein jhhlp_001247 [Lomentospora prolificans]